MSKTILSGIRATGRLHFGNFMGAVRHFVNFQNSDNRSMYFIADLHTLTTLRDPNELRGNVLEIAKDYLAAGLDPNLSVIYAQSSVPEISELSLLLSMIQPLGELERIPTFKDLLRKNADNVNLGLVSYPVLMAADILGPKADIVPVGFDQRPNVELARNLAQRFNARFGKTFVIPEMLDEDKMIKVPGLDGEKMGKSDSDNSIDINSSREVILKRYMERGVTDPERVKISIPGNPQHCRSVYPIHEIVTPGEPETRTIANACKTAQIGCADCKRKVVDGIATILEPFQEKRAQLAHQDDFIMDVLHEGGKKARTIIAGTVSDVRQKMGVVIY